MYEFCHRCQGELRTSGGGELLFCPHCSAPQILLPEHLRPEGPEPSSTGALPPPIPVAASPGQVDWRAALAAAGVVALVGAVLNLVGLKVPAVSVLGTFWVLGGSVIAVGLYARSRPNAYTDAKTGLRIGMATGLLSVALLGVALSGAGLVARFGLHTMGGFDALMAQQFGLLQGQMADRMREQGQDPAVQAKALGILGSPEVRGGMATAYSGFLGILVVLLSAGGGAFSGMMRGGRTARGTAR